MNEILYQFHRSKFSMNVTRPLLAVRCQDDDIEMLRDLYNTLGKLPRFGLSNESLSIRHPLYQSLTPKSTYFHFLKSTSDRHSTFTSVETLESLEFTKTMAEGQPDHNALISEFVSLAGVTPQVVRICIVSSRTTSLDLTQVNNRLKSTSQIALGN